MANERCVHATIVYLKRFVWLMIDLFWEEEHRRRKYHVFASAHFLNINLEIINSMKGRRGGNESHRMEINSFCRNSLEFVLRLKETHSSIVTMLFLDDDFLANIFSSFFAFKVRFIYCSSTDIVRVRTVECFWKNQSIQATQRFLSPFSSLLKCSMKVESNPHRHK